MRRRDSNPHLLALVPCILGCLLIGGGARAGAQPDPDHVFRAEEVAGPAGGQRTLRVFLDFPDALYGAQGWSFGVCQDPAELSVDDAVSGSAVFEAKNGQEADFHVVTLLAQGVVGGCIVCLNGCAFLPPGSDYELLVITYGLIASAGDVAAVEFCDTLGSPPISNGIVTEVGESIDPLTIPGSVVVLDAGAQPFVRGDCNQDGISSVGDAVFSLLFLFQQGTVPACEAACDVTANGVHGISDAISLLAFLFGGGPPPSAPFPECDFTIEGVCESSVCP